ncbi:transporter [Malaciobacter molluscorum LMG 25693]|uniref:Transporter n=1 Tax=Malaciobacter molluscorum LMG 25693 TaxID=870501 RepID=A0A2G1DG99_9BACT|nr:TolC family protein [Malaciobacter molluscorum]AXX93479.1 type I secretion system outer membrane protein, TolC family [Malaciobacter molluscorum LMG 25693]PHO17507.1 transporter [Malaciobacter molluscorum LMG 25693]
MKKFFVFFTFTLLLLNNLYALSLKESVERTLISNPDVMAERKNQEAYRYYVDEKQSKYLPTLDLSAFAEKSKVKDKYEDKDHTDTSKKGYNIGLTLRQLIYDGGLTPSEIGEMKHQNLSNKYRSLNAIENTVLETSKAYTALVKFNELMSLSEEMIKTNKNNLKIAKQKEEISGEVLETYQVSSKLHFATDKYYEEENSKQQQLNALKKYVGIDIKTPVCRPVINEKNIPNKLTDVIKKAVLSNYEIKEQLEKIRVQREKVEQNKASFLPTIDIELKASRDSDIELDGNGEEDENYARLNFNWNLFNGGANKVKDTQQKLFLQEQKKTLDEITNKVIQDVKDKYYRYQNDKKRVDVLKKYVDANANIVEVYKNEFEAGTRTFVDILNAQTELYQSTQSLIEREYSLFDNYYDLLYSLSKIGDSILRSKDQDCSKIKPRVYKIEPDKKREEFSDELKELLETNSSDIQENEISTASTQLYTLPKKEKNNKNLKEFLNRQNDDYTINLATVETKMLNDYLKKNNLIGKVIAFPIGKNKMNSKVLLGIFTKYSKAKEALNNLSKDILSSNPYVDNIAKHQELYRKYN